MSKYQKIPSIQPQSILIPENGKTDVKQVYIEAFNEEGQVAYIPVNVFHQVWDTGVRRKNKLDNEHRRRDYIEVRKAIRSLDKVRHSSSKNNR